LQEALDLNDDSILKASSLMAGGIGGMHDVCGSLLGAGMVLGMKYGRSRENISRKDLLEPALEPMGKLYKWFQKEFGSVNCVQIRTRFGGGVCYDNRVPWQAKLAKEAGIGGKCADLCGKTAARAAEMMLDE
jgi:C_GCAxxG_C_C family probable redox protein